MYELFLMDFVITLQKRILLEHVSVNFSFFFVRQERISRLEMFQKYEVKST